MADALELLDFETFFEAEPKKVSPDGWVCGADFTYQRGDDRIDARLVAVDGELSLKWWQAGKLRADIRLTGIVDWVIEGESGKELLRLKFQHPNVVYFLLQLRPHVSLGWATQWA